MTRPHDLTGQRFGRLVVLSRFVVKDKAQRNKSMFLCRCDCGEQTNVRLSALRDGGTKSCGCWKIVLAKNNSKKREITLVGRRFSYLLALERHPRVGKPTLYRCKCDCGCERMVDGGRLQRGETRHCGCRNKMEAKARGARKAKHPTHASVYCVYVYSAKKRGLPWTLSKDEFTTLVTGTCYYCGGPPTAREYRGKITVYNGIDRVDNSGGYTAINTVSCCYICNRAKSNLPLSTFITWVKAAYARLGSI